MEKENYQCEVKFTDWKGKLTYVKAKLTAKR